jgi:NTP pyrophosphatase (non-canonical NTP hydrolase)
MRTKDKIEEFSDAVARTAKSMPTQEVDGPTLNMLHWVLGIAGEAGELIDPIKKCVFYNKELDIGNVQEELGDILYYTIALINELGLDPEYVMSDVIYKLQLRYPEGYSDEHAQLRLDKEGISNEGC